MRLIDADKLLKEADAEGAWGYVDKIQIFEAPTIRLEDLILKGEWIDEPSDGIWTTTCSNCGTEKSQHEHTKYCPDCGAIMDGVKFFYGSKWIDFNITKPEHGQYVLGLTAEDDMEVYFFDKEWENCLCQYGGNVKTFHITHWMPLPTLPNKIEKDNEVIYEI